MNGHTAFLKHLCICQHRLKGYVRLDIGSCLFWKLGSSRSWQAMEAWYSAISLVRPLYCFVHGPLSHICSPDVLLLFYGFLVTETFKTQFRHFIEDKIKFKPCFILFFNFFFLDWTSEETVCASPRKPTWDLMLIGWMMFNRTRLHWVSFFWWGLNWWFLTGSDIL